MRKLLIIFVTAAALLTACNGKGNLQDLAKEDVLSSLPYPDKTNILNFSEPDSAFGVYYFEQKELIQILTTMKKVSDYIMSKSDNILDMDKSNNYLVNLTERHMEAGSTMRTVLMNSQKKGDFTGYKMRVIYETVDKDNTKYRCARYIFFNKDNSRVLKSFDIPLL